MIAAFEGKLEIVKLLVEAGADMEMMNPQQCTCLLRHAKRDGRTLLCI